MENSPKMSLGNFISDRRKSMSMTQEELAERIHVSKSAIAKWETNRGIPDRDNVKRLAKVLQISVDSIYRLMDVSDQVDSVIDSCITADLIALLESYGYVIIPPAKESKSDSDTAAPKEGEKQ